MEPRAKKASEKHSESSSGKGSWVVTFTRAGLTEGSGGRGGGTSWKLKKTNQKERQWGQLIQTPLHVDFSYKRRVMELKLEGKKDERVFFFFFF